MRFFLRTKPSTLQRKRVNVCFRSVRCTGSHSVCRGCRLGTSQLVFSGMDHLFTRFLLFSKQRQLRHLLTPRWPVKAEGQTWGQLWTLFARCQLPCRIVVIFFCFASYPQSHNLRGRDGYRKPPANAFRQTLAFLVALHDASRPFSFFSFLIHLCVTLCTERYARGPHALPLSFLKYVIEAVHACALPESPSICLSLFYCFLLLHTSHWSTARLFVWLFFFFTPRRDSKRQGPGESP